MIQVGGILRSLGFVTELAEVQELIAWAVFSPRREERHARCFSRPWTGFLAGVFRGLSFDSTRRDLAQERQQLAGLLGVSPADAYASRAGAPAQL